MMSYVHKVHTKPLEHRTPFQFLQVHANVHPDKEAFVFRDEKKNRTSLTFKEYETQSRLLAAAFLEMGLVHGDRVLVMLPSCVEFVLIHMALNRIGANMIAVEDDAFPAVLGIVNLACVVTGVEIDTPSINHEKVLQNIKIGLEENNLKAAVLVSPDAGLLKDHEKVFLYKEMLDMAGDKKIECNEAVQQAEAAVQMDDPTLVLFTSGSTSFPKPIQYTNHCYVNGSITDASMMLIDENSIYFSDSPFDWISGLCFSIGVVITKGSTLVVFPPKLAFKGGLVPTILQTMEEEECTHALVLAYLLHDITTRTDLPAIKLSKLKVAITGGQACPITLFKSFLDMFPHLTICNTYGATETNLIAHQLMTKDNIDTIDYGLMDIVDGFELKIVNEKRNVLPQGTKGELCLRSAWVSFPNWDLMLGERKRTTGIGQNGWHFSCDGASLDQDGRLRLQGRLDDMIKCATESIAPCEIEGLLLGNPYVKKVCVVGVPDQRLHEKICACIVLKDGNDGDKEGHIENELEKWCSDNCWVSNIGLPLKPHYYILVREFPLTRTGKLSRRLVREMANKKLGF